VKCALLKQLELASVSPVRRNLIGNLLLQTSGSDSRGVPVGPQASHLLAEAALIPLDNFLRPHYRCTRYADDVHVFCKTYKEAQTAIFQIAGYLDKDQRLRLNSQKTGVKTSADFGASAGRMLIDDPINQAEERMLEVLRDSLEEFGELDADDYAEIRLSDLDRADADLFSPKLLVSVLAAYLKKDPASYIRLRWFLRRITQVGAAGAVEFVASQIDRFAPAIVDAVRYLNSAADEYSGSWKTLGNQLIKSLGSPLIRSSDYLQVSIVGLFSRVIDLNHIGKLQRLFRQSGPSVQREIVLATSAQAGPDWVRQHIPELPAMDIWLKRAVLYAVSDLPEGERRIHAASKIDTVHELMTNRLLKLPDAPTQSSPAKGRAAEPAGLQPTIGIVTALPKELAAMRTMLLNERRISINRGGGMKELILGEIPARDGGIHLVALALSGMGTNQAAARATHLLRDFSSIKHLFMVGIAGGIPDPESADNHVRLGDIVVSGEHGVIQYDFVKDSRAKIQHRAVPRPPSSSVLEAVRFLESDSFVGPNRLAAHIAIGMKALKRRRPAAKYDVLRSSKGSTQVKHPNDPSRKAGEPRVFVGPIASANVLLKNQKRRDELRDKFQVKAVEMEGSGIADASWNGEVDYLVVRGICDYCDKNKEDRWQYYAALVSAAYTRTLLESMPAAPTG